MEKQRGREAESKPNLPGKASAFHFVGQLHISAVNIELPLTLAENTCQHTAGVNSWISAKSNFENWNPKFEQTYQHAYRLPNWSVLEPIYRKENGELKPL